MTQTGQRPLAICMENKSLSIDRIPLMWATDPDKAGMIAWVPVSLLDAAKADLTALRAQLEDAERLNHKWLIDYGMLAKSKAAVEVVLTELRADYEYCKKERAAAREDANTQRRLHQELDSAHKRVKSALTALRSE